jgi:thymidylate synthase (FAD)
MPESQIKVRLNPDSMPTGSDLTCVNAARRSFNTRSDWDYLLSNGEVLDFPAAWSRRDLDENTTKKLKDRDKRLIEFLARGMTADDFEQFLLDTSEVGKDWIHGEALYIQDSKQLFKDLLWQWRNTPTHDTPFNHCFISFEVQAPIFVRAQLVKHEYLIMSEFSRRYITDDIQFYQPDVWRGKAESKKQGSAGVVELGKLEDPQLGMTLENYHYLLAKGVAPEQARMVLPQSTMTEWTWSGTLGAFAKMCQLRLHPDAQYEARLVAQQVYDYLKQHYPVSAVALVEGVK